jgi:hypothetical protein
MGKDRLDNQLDIAAPRASGILWRIVFGLVVLFLMTAGGAWLMDAGIDRSLEAQAAGESGPSASATQQRN